MNFMFHFKMLDVSDNVLVSEDVESPHPDFRVPLKLETANFKSKNPGIDWKKLSIVIEKV